jgi:hypothetical protein
MHPDSHPGNLMKIASKHVRAKCSRIRSYPGLTIFGIEVLEGDRGRIGNRSVSGWACQLYEGSVRKLPELIHPH